MEKLIQRYLRILDIDPLGVFIRLINISHDQSLDLSNINIRQVRISNATRHSIEQDLTLTSYTLKDQIRLLLRSGEVVTIYSKGYDQLKFNIEPYAFIAQDVRRWLTEDHIRTEITMNEIVFHSAKFWSFSSSDIPPLFINRSTDSKQLSTKSIFDSNRYDRFIFPYCLSDTNTVNPHTWATSDRNDNNRRRNSCYTDNQIVKHFDSYPRRLTTSPHRIQSSKNTSHS